MCYYEHKIKFFCRHLMVILASAAMPVLHGCNPATSAASSLESEKLFALNLVKLRERCTFEGREFPISTDDDRKVTARAVFAIMHDPAVAMSYKTETMVYFGSSPGRQLGRDFFVYCRKLPDPMIRLFAIVAVADVALTEHDRALAHFFLTHDKPSSSLILMETPSWERICFVDKGEKAASLLGDLAIENSGSLQKRCLSDLREFKMAFADNTLNTTIAKLRKNLEINIR